MAHREIPNDTRRRALALYRRGFSAAAVGRRVAVSDMTVLRWARAAGIVRSPREARAVRESRSHGQDYPELVARAVDMLRETDWSAARVARVLDEPPHKVRAWARSAGIDLVERQRERGCTRGGRDG